MVGAGKDLNDHLALAPLVTGDRDNPLVMDRDNFH